MSVDIRPAVSREALAKFMAQAKKYINKNRVMVPDSQQTSDDIKNKPFLYQKCEVRETGNCPSQSSSKPNCDACAHALAATGILHEITQENGFVSSEASSNKETGTLSMQANKKTGPDFILFEVSGENEGVIMGTLQPTRRPKVKQ